MNPQYYSFSDSYLLLVKFLLKKIPMLYHRSLHIMPKTAAKVNQWAGNSISFSFFLPLLISYIFFSLSQLTCRSHEVQKLDVTSPFLKLALWTAGIWLSKQDLCLERLQKNQDLHPAAYSGRWQLYDWPDFPKLMISRGLPQLCKETQEYVHPS